MSAIVNGFAIFGRLLQLDAKRGGGRALKSFVMLKITFGFFYGDTKKWMDILSANNCCCHKVVNENRCRN